LDQFLNTNISQDNEATCLRYGKIFSRSLCCKFTAESAGERILKIGQHLAKLSTGVECPVFWLTK